MGGCRAVGTDALGEERMHGPLAFDEYEAEIEQRVERIVWFVIWPVEGKACRGTVQGVDAWSMAGLRGALRQAPTARPAPAAKQVQGGGEGMQ